MKFSNKNARIVKVDETIIEMDYDAFLILNTGIVIKFNRVDFNDVKSAISYAEIIGANGASMAHVGNSDSCYMLYAYLSSRSINPYSVRNIADIPEETGIIENV